MKLPRFVEHPIDVVFGVQPSGSFEQDFDKARRAAPFSGGQPRVARRDRLRAPSDKRQSRSECRDRERARPADDLRWPLRAAAIEVLKMRKDL
ncbi:hypothetical protein LB577_25220 [Mesorhizobium sp. B283B1A]|uniref:hypothetical protein n=1 Tax=Mesorhizobium TaxID=68287 RepID=UPI001CD0A630|nr:MULTISPECIES: hypothetical protein [Mesorhizobium]MCA0050216.1 hypothetical protein [Mesorhizobium sp. B283B1A]UQS66583.1 hypothetical protein M5D98_09730 [Mesorhizobium opportunistum]